MPLRDLLIAIYAWTDGHAMWTAAGLIAVPVAGTLAARIGRGGSSDRDGRWIASQVILVSALGVVVLVLGLATAHLGFDKSMLDANILLVAAPILALVASVVGIRWVFPLNELSSVRTLTDVALFILACAVFVWLLGKFRGWGFLFLGGPGALVVMAVFAGLLLRHLFARAFRAPR